MKIHTDLLTEADVHAAVRSHGMKGVYAEVQTVGARSAKRGRLVKLSGTSNRNQNPGTGPRYNIEKAATFDEWGMVIDYLYSLDPNAVIGQYQSKGHFVACTFDRYESLTQPYAHGNHRWQNVNGISRCDCGADFDFRKFHNM